MPSETIDTTTMERRKGVSVRSTIQAWMPPSVSASNAEPKA